MRRAGLPHSFAPHGRGAARGHRFYVGKVGTGILMLITFGGLGIWTLVDFIMIVTGNFRDKAGLPIKASH